MFAVPEIHRRRRQVGGGGQCAPNKFGSQKFGQNGGRIRAKWGKNSGKLLGEEFGRKFGQKV